MDHKAQIRFIDKYSKYFSRNFEKYVFDNKSVNAFLLIEVIRIVLTLHTIQILRYNDLKI